MRETVKDVLNFLLENYDLYVVIALIISATEIFFLLNLIKIPIKKLTAKIENEPLRKFANKSIILLSFGLSALGWGILSWVAPKYFQMDWVLVLLDGAFPIVVYSLQDGIITKKQAKEITNTLIDISKDGEITKDEVKDVVNKKLADKAVDVVVDKIKEKAKEERKATAEENLDQMLK